jgi:hypothetical protein
MNFNFGEHYYEGSSIWMDLLVTIIGGAIGFGTALLFYYQQNQRDKRKEIESIDAEFKDTLSYIKLLIDGIVKTIEQQNIKSVEFAEKVKLNPVEMEHLMIVAGQDTERFHSIDSSKVFLTFRHKFLGKNDGVNFQTLYGHIDFIHGHLKEIVSVFKNYQKGTYDQLMKFKSIVDNLPDVMSDMGLEIIRTVPDYKKDERFIFLENSIMKYRELADNHGKIADYDAKFLDPVLREVIAKYQLTFFGPRIMDMCKKARVLLNDMVVDSNDTADTILSSPGLLEKSKNYLIEVSKKIG